MPKPRELALPSDPVAARITALVNERYGGNVTKAAAEMGVGYYRLYDVLRGEARPSLDVVVAAARCFAVPVEILTRTDAAPQRVEAER